MKMNCVPGITQYFLNSTDNLKMQRRYETTMFNMQLMLNSVRLMGTVMWPSRNEGRLLRSAMSSRRCSLRKESLPLPRPFKMQTRRPGVKGVRGSGSEYANISICLSCLWQIHTYAYIDKARQENKGYCVMLLTSLSREHAKLTVNNTQYAPLVTLTAAAAEWVTFAPATFRESSSGPRR